MDPGLFSTFFKNSLSDRNNEGLLRTLKERSGLIDFSSNDYLGFASSHFLYSNIKELEKQYADEITPGSGASRLISGNHPLFRICEDEMAEFHNSKAALIFNSGYDANIGILSSLGRKDITVIYDEFCHASIRDGIRLGFARAYSFKHCDLEDFKKKAGQARGQILAVVESVYSMDGIRILPDNQLSGQSFSPRLRPFKVHYWLEEFIEYCHKNQIEVIVDEAHGTGVFGENGQGVISECGLEEKVLARVHTFGKALGVHGAAVLGSELLRDYLINHARSFIYTTALPPHSLLSILAAYRFLKASQEKIHKLTDLILTFNQKFYGKPIQNPSSIHYKIIPGNSNCRSMAEKCRQAGLDVRAILSPTVAENTERLRICLHSFNTIEEVNKLLEITGNADD